MQPDARSTSPLPRQSGCLQAHSENLIRTARIGRKLSARIFELQFADARNTISIMSVHDPDQESAATRRADRVAGCLVGLAVGDALGAPLEFSTRREVRNRFPQGLREMIVSPQRGKGEYTDDTQMALLIAESLLEKKAFVAQDVAKRFEIWARTAGDVGLQTRAVVTMARYLQDPEPACVVVAVCSCR